MAQVAPITVARLLLGEIGKKHLHDLFLVYILSKRQCPLLGRERENVAHMLISIGLDNMM